MSGSGGASTSMIVMSISDIFRCLVLFLQKSEAQDFYIFNGKENKQIHTLEKLQPENVWYFCLTFLWNVQSIIKVVAMSVNWPVD